MLLSVNNIAQKVGTRTIWPFPGYAYAISCLMDHETSFNDIL